MGIIKSKSSGSSINLSSNFKMQLKNGALFLSANFLSYTLLFGFATVIFHVTMP